MARKKDDDQTQEDQTQEDQTSENNSSDDASGDQAAATTADTTALADADSPATNDPATAARPETAEPKKRGKQWRLQLGTGNRPYPSVSINVGGRSLVIESRRATPPVSTQAKNAAVEAVEALGLDEDDLKVEEVK